MKDQCGNKVVSNEVQTLRARLAEIKAQRDELKDVLRNIVDTHKLEFLSGRIGYLLVSTAREALAKLGEK